MKEFLELRQQVAKLEKDIEEKEVELVKLQKEIKKVKTAREDIERSRLLKQYDEQEKVDNEMRAKKAKKEKELELIKKRKRDSEARRQKSVQERLEAEQASNPQSAVLEHVDLQLHLATHKSVLITHFSPSSTSLPSCSKQSLPCLCSSNIPVSRLTTMAFSGEMLSLG